MNHLHRARCPKRCALLSFIGFFLINAGWLVNASASVEEQTGFLAITEENDSLSNPFGQHQDRHYTQGLKISLFGGDDFLTNVTTQLNNILPAIGFRPEAGDLGWVMLGQNIYTPSNILTHAPIKSDRPYGGWLYTGAIYQRRGDITPNLQVMENFEINIGVVGPDSLAAQSQKTVHHWYFGHTDTPEGWNNQLKDEPGLDLKYARLWRWSFNTESARYIDVIPHIGGEVGNVFTFAEAGGTLRLGYNLPPDFGIQIIDSPASVNGGLTRHAPAFFGYVFGGVDGRAVGYDVMLDGNTFHAGPSVEKNILVGDASYGFALQFFHHVEFAYTRVIRTEEFRRQQHNDIFGSLTLKAKFCF